MLHLICVQCTIKILKIMKNEVHRVHLLSLYTENVGHISHTWSSNCNFRWGKLGEINLPNNVVVAILQTIAIKNKSLENQRYLNRGTFHNNYSKLHFCPNIFFESSPYYIEQHGPLHHHTKFQLIKIGWKLDAFIQSP